MNLPLPALAAYGLPGARQLEAHIHAASVQQDLQAVRRHKLLGLLDQAIADGAVAVEDDAHDQIGGAVIETAAWTLLVERHQIRVHRLLADARIESQVIKGPRMAHLTYAHPGLHPFVDVDVLVRPGDLGAAVDALARQGHHRVKAPFAPGFDAAFGKSVTLRSADRIEVDLHCRLTSGPFGLRHPPELLWELPPDPLPLGGTDLPALAEPAAVVHALLHAATDERLRLGTLRDALEAVERSRGHGTWVDAVGLADRMGARACGRVVAERTRDDLALDTPTVRELLDWPVNARERRWLRSYQLGRARGSQALAVLQALPGPTTRARFIATSLRGNLRLALDGRHRSAGR